MSSQTAKSRFDELAKDDQSFDWKPLFEQAASEMQVSIQQEVARRNNSSQAIIFSSALTVVGAIFSALTVWCGLFIRNNFMIDGNLTTAGTSLSPHILLLAMAAFAIGICASVGVLGAGVEQLLRDIKQYKKNKKTTVQEELKLIIPQPIKYSLRSQRSKATGKVEAVLTKSTPTVGNSQSPSRLGQSSEEEVFRVPLQNQETASIVDEFGDLLKEVERLQASSQVTYEKCLHEYKLSGWLAEHEQLLNMKSQVQEIRENIMLNEGIEDALNDLARSSEQQSSEQATLT